MRILEIDTNNYRNLGIKNQAFCEGTNFIYGENAQGKTNLTEAIWMFTGARSFRGTKDTNLIKFGEDSAWIKAKVYADGREQEIKITFADGKRKAFLNDVPQKYPTEIIGMLRIVLFSPIHLSLISGGPEKRRKFLDAAICQLKPTYTALLIRYNQILKQRNSLLKKPFEQNNDFLDVLDAGLCRTAAKIMNQRFDYMEFLKSEAIKIYSEISGGRENFNIRYISKIMSFEDFNTQDFEKNMLEKLKNSREMDFKLGFTSIGPHKDELEFYVDKKPVKIFGSQGQQRSAALSLKLAEAGILNKKFSDPPIILLDDVMSELDDNRKLYMVQKIKDWQVFITGCDRSALDMMNSGKSYEIKNGKVIHTEEI